MDALIAAIEGSALGITVRESLWVYPTLLTLHAIGLAFLVGISTAVDLRLLGVARDLPVTPMARLFPVMYAGFWVNALSGFALLFAQTTKLLHDPVFYLKMAFIIGGTLVILRLNRLIFTSGHDTGVGALPGNVKALAGISLAMWTGAIVAGRLTAYGFFR